MPGSWGVLAVLSFIAVAAALAEMQVPHLCSRPKNLHFVKFPWPSVRTPPFENLAPQYSWREKMGYPSDLNSSIGVTLLSWLLLAAFPFWGFPPVVKWTRCYTQHLLMAVEVSWVDGRHCGAGLWRTETSPAMRGYVPRRLGSPSCPQGLWLLSRNIGAPWRRPLCSDFSGRVVGIQDHTHTLLPPPWPIVGSDLSDGRC